MSIDEEERPKSPSLHSAGEDLSTLSEEGLTERIELLHAEIRRIDRALDAKRESRITVGSAF